MEFAANQSFRISGGYEDLESILKFALKRAGFKPLLKDRLSPTNFVIQNTGSMFCIGTAETGKINRGVKPPAGWTRFDGRGDYDVKTLSETVILALTEMEPANNLTSEPGPEGKVLNGFICMAPWDMSTAERGRIQSPEYCVVGFKPWQYYYK